MQAYLSYCHDQHWTPQISGFAKRLPKLMAILFGASHAHDLERFGKKNIRGYRMVAFLEEPEPTEDDWN